VTIVSSFATSFCETNWRNINLHLVYSCVATFFTPEHSTHFQVKFMKKHEIVKLKQVDHINGERNLMSQIHHPFIVEMKGSFKDERFVYIVMEV